MAKTSKYTAMLTATMVRIDKVTPAGNAEWRYSDCKALRRKVEEGEVLKQSYLRKIFRELFMFANGAHV